MLKLLRLAGISRLFLLLLCLLTYGITQTYHVVTAQSVSERGKDGDDDNDDDSGSGDSGGGDSGGGDSGGDGSDTGSDNSGNSDDDNNSGSGSDNDGSNDSDSDNSGSDNSGSDNSGSDSDSGGNSDNGHSDDDNSNDDGGGNSGNDNSGSDNSGSDDNADDNNDDGDNNGNGNNGNSGGNGNNGGHSGNDPDDDDSGNSNDDAKPEDKDDKPEDTDEQQDDHSGKDEKEDDRLYYVGTVTASDGSSLLVDGAKLQGNSPWIEVMGTGMWLEAYGYWQGEDTFVADEINVLAGDDWAYVRVSGVLLGQGEGQIEAWTRGDKIDTQREAGQTVTEDSVRVIAYFDGTKVRAVPQALTPPTPDLPAGWVEFTGRFDGDGIVWESPRSFP